MVECPQVPHPGLKETTICPSTTHPHLHSIIRPRSTCQSYPLASTRRRRPSVLHHCSSILSSTTPILPFIHLPPTVCYLLSIQCPVHKTLSPSTCPLSSRNSLCTLSLSQCHLHLLLSIHSKKLDPVLSVCPAVLQPLRTGQRAFILRDPSTYTHSPCNTPI